MKTLEITVSANVCGHLLDCNVEIGSEENIKERILEQLDDEWKDNNTTIKDIIFEVIDWNELTDYENLQKELEELADYSGDNDLDVVSAARECDIDYKNIDEAYSGSFRDDEDFAEDMAISLGYMDKTPQWPFTCIDWTQAASELMYDYSESNGYYFRNF
jgi:hypothetical protein